MEKSFGSLLRHSRLASYDRTLEQVYRTPKKHRKIGDWGLKRNLPTVIRTNHLIINGLDTAEHQTPWQSGESKILFIKCWKENFPNSKKPTPRPEEITYHAAAMTPAEFKQLLKRAEKQAPAFQQALKLKEIASDQVFDYLNVDFADTLEKTGGAVVGPTYSNNDVGWDYPVQGRILNGIRTGNAIGIGGVVATLPKRNSIGLRNSGDRKIRTVYVRHAELDENGKPKVEVTSHHKGTASSIPLLSDYEGYEFGFGNQDRQSGHSQHRRFGDTIHMTASEMMDKRHSNRLDKVKETSDNIAPNPEHAELMSRIAHLLNGSRDKDKQ